MPLLSKICPVCGYAVDGDGANCSASEFADRLEETLRDIKAIPRPSFLKGMNALSVVMLPLLTLFLLAAAVISEAGLFWILTALFGAWSLVVIVLKLTGNLGNDRRNRRFAQLKNDYEYRLRLARREFGKSREVAALLNEISAEIEMIEADRKAAARRNLLIWLGILAVIVLLAFKGVFSVNEIVNGTPEAETETTAAEQTTATEEGKGAAAAQQPAWREAVERFRRSPENNAYGDVKARLAVLNEILRAGDTEAAAEFFLTDCMGAMGDYECAAAVVEHFNSRSDAAGAERFVGRCTAMRYKSDKTKLEKLIKR